MFLSRRHPNSSDELSRLFDGFFGPALSFFPAAGNPATAATPWPRLDVSETADAVHVSAELPGVSQDNIDVEIHADTLRVSGEKKDEREVNEHNFHSVERRFGRFERMISLPAEIDVPQAEATFKDGVLSINLPKVKPVAAHKISVKSAT
jgi:HSP20 family protein